MPPTPVCSKPPLKAYVSPSPSPMVRVLGVGPGKGGRRDDGAVAGQADVSPTVLFALSVAAVTAPVKLCRAADVRQRSGFRRSSRRCRHIRTRQSDTRQKSVKIVPGGGHHAEVMSPVVVVAFVLIDVVPPG